MKNSVSDRSIYIESDEEDEENVPVKDGEGSESDSSVSSVEIQRQQSKPGSYNTSWPQSYRQSIDQYSSVPSPSIGFLGTPTLSRLSGSFLSSSLTRRHTPEIMSSVVYQPLIAEERPPRERRSSHSLLPPFPRKSSMQKDEKLSKAGGHELPMPRQSSYGQAVLNGMYAPSIFLCCNCYSN